MGYVVLECPRCHASLEIAPDKIIAYCPYCGTKLTFDAEQLTALLREKEKTKQVDMQTSADVKKTEITSNAEVKKQISENLSLIIFFIVLFGFIILLRFLLPIK